MAENCGECARLAAENARLNQRIAALERENKSLKLYIAYLLDKLRRIAEYARRVVAQAERVMLEHQPRGVWAFARGGKEVAQRVRRLL